MFKRFHLILMAAVLFLLTSGVKTAGAAPDSGAKADALIGQMTLQEKIGQMTLIDKIYLEDEADIRNYSIGALLSGGDSSPKDLTAAGWAKMHDHYQSIALKSRLGIPLLYGIDAVHGHSKVVDATIFPHNIGMGCTGNPELIEEAAAVTAREMAATGIRWNYAPCISVVRDQRWGRTYESYGENTGLVTRMGVATIRGLQGDRSAGVISTAKHFIADGGTLNGKNEGNAEGTEQQLRRLFLPPYIAAISNGTKVVMASFSSWNGMKMHANRWLLTDVLKNELKFGGFIVSDWGAVGHLSGDFAEQLKTAINAGIDMVMLPRHYKKFAETMLALVQNGGISQARVDDAVRRILKVKIEMGLFEKPFSDKNLLKEVGSARNKKIARQCVRESAVLLKNENGMLPLSKKLKKIVVAGTCADSIDIQCGGWTITWQGNSGLLTAGSSVLKAVRKAVSSRTKVLFYPTDELPADADAAIVVTGEYPYAESMGDKDDLPLNAEDRMTIETIVQKGIPVVVVMISGRPMFVKEDIKKWNAFLAVWLPGPEGEGIADVLFGDTDPKGRLSITWPKDVYQLPIYAGDKDRRPLFEYGFGLSYKKKK